MPALYTVFALLLMILLYLFAIHPHAGRRDRMKNYKYIAHRGLFDNASAPENSIPAFKKAVESGFGIELDVQLTADNRLVVFHDDTLERVCGSKAALRDMPYDELSTLKLFGSDESIPLFEDVLKSVDGAVPLIIEIKSDKNYLQTAKSTNEALKNYRGEYCIESFNPLVLRWFRKNNKNVLRGQLAPSRAKNKSIKALLASFALSALIVNFLSAPDFIAYNHIRKNRLSLKLCKKLFGAATAAWTIRSQKELDAAKEMFEIFIFDGFIPK